MAMNSQTQAIVDRLKEEGLLIRNKGTNSIKSVKETLTLELGKFQGTFDAIRQSMGYMDQAAVDQAELAKRNADLAALSEDERNAVLKTIADNAAKQANLDERELALRNEDLKKKEKTDIKLFGKNGLIGSALTKVKDFAVNAAVLGLTGAAVYEFIAGFIEKQFGIELPTVADAFRGIYNALKDIDWMKLKENLAFLADPEFLKKAGIALGVATGGALLTDVAKDATLYALLYQAVFGRGPQLPAPTGTPPTGTPPGGGTPSRGGRVFGKIRGPLIAALGTAAIIYAEDIADFMRDEFTDLTPEEIKNTPIGLPEAGVSALGGAAIGGTVLTLGGFMALWPALAVGALAGIVWTAGSAILENVNERAKDLESSGLGRATFNALKAEADKAAGNRMRYVPNLIDAARSDLEYFNDEIEKINERLERGGMTNARGKFIAYNEAYVKEMEQQRKDLIQRRLNVEKLMNERINAEIEKGNIDYIPQDAFNERLRKLRALQEAGPNAQMERGRFGRMPNGNELIDAFEIDGVKYKPEQLQEKIEQLENTYKSRFGQQELDKISDLGRVLKSPEVAAAIASGAAAASAINNGKGNMLAYQGGSTIVNNNITASNTRGGDSFTNIMTEMFGKQQVGIPGSAA